MPEDYPHHSTQKESEKESLFHVPDSVARHQAKMDIQSKSKEQLFAGWIDQSCKERLGYGAIKSLLQCSDSGRK